MTSTSIRRRCVATVLAGLSSVAAAAASAAPRHATAALAEPLHALAEQAFRHGRLAEAYGRFVALADAGHAASTHQAPRMCEHGPELFGCEWDCAPHQVAHWTVAAGRAPMRGPVCVEMSSQQGAPDGRRR